MCPRKLYFLGFLFCVPFVTLGQSFTCNPPMANPIVCENSKPGNPPSDWDVSGFGDPGIQGFATDISVNQGQIISFKVNTSHSYQIYIYRLGYYNGNGARLITTIQPIARSQPPCTTDGPTGLFDCGNWLISASWAVPSNATSGVYIANLVRADSRGNSHIIFVVRNDSSHSDLLFKTSDTAWEAYNWYGGAGTGTPGGGQSLYGCSRIQYGDCQAFKVSYNRPLDTRGMASPSAFFSAEYPMVRFLEANGYDVSYISSVDADRTGSLLLQHKTVLSVGHDEYWSGNERSNFEAARAAKINLAFFSGNEIFWKIRWENSIDGTNTPYRTLVCYKETDPTVPADPNDPPTWTGTWRDPTKSPPADGGRPENALSGTLFMVNAGSSASIIVPQADGRMRFWRNTAAATLGAGQSYSTPNNTLGYEWDIDPDNGFRPAGEFWLSTATYAVSGTLLLDYGNNSGNGTATHHLTLYRDSSGALVFGAGTVQWSWGLDANTPTSADVNMQQATVNLLADMGAQPATLQAGLVLATASTDSVAPTSIITSPVTGTSVPSGTQVTVSGTASDAGGGLVGGVEVSVNGGASWHPAVGRANWSFSWTAAAPATYTIQSRAVDDSGNLEIPSTGVKLNVTGSSAPRYRVTFDDLPSPGRILGGEYPTGIVNWSLGGWFLSGPWGAFSTQSISFFSSTQTRANFGVFGQFRVISIDAYNGGSTNTTVALSCPGHAQTSMTMAVGQVATIQTGWPDSCSPVTVSSSNGWFTNFDNLVLEYLGVAPVGPVISNVGASSVSTTGATITWTTNVAANSQVEYGTTTAYGNSSPLDSRLVTSHSQALAGLTPATLYHYRVHSADVAGNSTVSSDFTFATAGPIISNVHAGAITTSGATITWTTNVAASSQVEYGTSTAYGRLSPLDANLVTSHSEPLSGLAANTVYHYRVHSTDAANNSSVSPDFSFTTAANTIIITFDDLSPAGRVLSGQYPTGVIDWGAGTNWWLSEPWGLFTTQSLSFNGSSVTSASFAFVGNRRLLSLQAYNGDTANATLTISCPGQTNVQATLRAGQISTVSTGWSNNCSPVTLSTSNGWFTNFKNLIVDSVGTTMASLTVPLADPAIGGNSAQPDPATGTDSDDSNEDLPDSATSVSKTDRAASDHNERLGKLNGHQKTRSSLVVTPNLSPANFRRSSSHRGNF